MQTESDDCYLGGSDAAGGAADGSGHATPGIPESCKDGQPAEHVLG